MKRILTYIALLFAFVSNAQQDAIYSQYLFNPFAINPAYAGTRDAINVVIVNRSQWSGLDGAPTTQTVSGHVPMNRKNIAWGAQLSRDKIGPTNNMLVNATGAYQLKLERGTLNFGLRGGIYNSVLDHAALHFREENDALDIQQKVSAIVPTFDFGIYYYTEQFFAGLAVNHLTKHNLKYSDLLENQNYFLQQHFFFSTGYVFEMSPKVLFKPTVLIKYAGPNTFNIDFNAHMMYNEKFWVGIGLRNFSSVNFLVDFNVTDYLRIGYSYDLNLTKLKNFSYGSHEFLIGFDFNVKKSTIISPRHL
jgi:type IX secretion system PorP/SprF family membrane protein